MAVQEQQSLGPSVSDLEKRLAEVRAMVGGLEAGSAPRLASMTDRMTDLLQQAREVREVPD
jgi:hypothetical protein